MHEWMVDNGFTPHLVVDASREGVQVPKEHVKDGKIVLNVSHSATRALKLGNPLPCPLAGHGSTRGPTLVQFGQERVRVLDAVRLTRSGGEVPDVRGDDRLRIRGGQHMTGQPAR